MNYNHCDLLLLVKDYKWDCPLKKLCLNLRKRLLIV